MRLVDGGSMALAQRHEGAPDPANGNRCQRLTDMEPKFATGDGH